MATIGTTRIPCFIEVDVEAGDPEPYDGTSAFIALAPGKNLRIVAENGDLLGSISAS